MNATNLLYGLNRFLVLAKQIAEKIGADENANIRFEVSLSYDTIEIKLETADSEEVKRLVQCVFEIKQSGVTVKEICADNTETASAVKILLDHQFHMDFVDWSTPSKDAPPVAAVEHYLNIADTIASEAYLINSGDDYKPGYFTEIILASEGITLTQINRHNSRSSDHKNDYFMRELRFFIPFGSGKKENSFADEVETIGEMQVIFSDHSSLQNRTAGDNIRAKIKEMKLNFE